MLWTKAKWEEAFFEAKCVADENPYLAGIGMLKSNTHAIFFLISINDADKFLPITKMSN